MSHDHSKKHQGHHHHDTHKKKQHGGEDHGKLHHAIKNKDDGDYNEMGPDYQPVPADAPKDLEGQINTAVDKDGRAFVSVNRGKNDGVAMEMLAYFIDDKGTKYSLAITNVADKYTEGWVDATAYHITSSSLRVVFNPSK